MLLILLTAQSALAIEPVKMSIPDGEIDWSSLRLEISITSEHTMGAWQDRRVQEQDALTLLKVRVAELAEEVPITADLKAGDLMSGGDELAAALRDGLRRWYVEETRYYDSGGVELVGVLELRTWLQPALLSLSSGGNVGAPTEHTGLVIDARGLRFPLSMAPRVVTATGRPLLHPAALSVQAIRQNSPALYVRDPADPRAAQRAGEEPLFARVASVTPDGSLVLDTESAQRLTASPDLLPLVARGEVVIVVDP